MRSRIAVLLALLSTALFAETVVKNSAPFSFPLTVGISANYSLQTKEIVFSSVSHSSNRSVVELSWSLPGSTRHGTVSVFNIAGSVIKTFAVTSSRGSVQWDVSGAAGKMAAGIYFAKLSSGVINQNLKIILY